MTDTAQRIAAVLLAVKSGPAFWPARYSADCEQIRADYAARKNKLGFGTAMQAAATEWVAEVLADHASSSRGVAGATAREEPEEWALPPDRGRAS